MIKEFKSLYVDAEKGIFEVNGEKIENVSAFSAAFKDGEYGLMITRDDMYASNAENSNFFVSVLPDEVFNKGVSGESKKP